MESEVSKSTQSIRSSEINVKDIISELNKKIKLKNVSKSDISLIQNLDLTSDFSSFEREFDPAFTANQFDKGISPPKFTNPRYWFIKGPLKFFINRLVDFYSLIDKKISENRIQAFHTVIYELIRTKKKLARLEKKVFDLSQEINKLRIPNEKPNHQVKFMDFAKPLEVEFSKDDEALLNEFSISNKILLIHPEENTFINLLKVKNYSYNILINKHSHSKEIFQDNTNKIIESEFYLFKDYKAYDSVLFYQNICFENSIALEKLILNQRNFSKPKTKFILRFSNQTGNSLSPFCENTKISINPENLKSYLLENDFTNISFLESNNLNLNTIIYFKK